MEAQSAALAFGFGLNYEYGKRKIRSMSNDEFNSLTSEQITNMSNAHTHIILSKFQAQVPAVMPMQATIFTQYVAIEKLKVQQNVELFKWVLAYAKSIGDDTLAHLLGGHLHNEILEPYVTPPDKFINPDTGEQGSEPTPTFNPDNFTEAIPTAGSAGEPEIVKIPIPNAGGKILGTTSATRLNDWGSNPINAYTRFMEQESQPWILHSQDQRSGNTSGMTNAMTAALNEILKTNPDGYRYFRVLYYNTTTLSTQWLQFLK